MFERFYIAESEGTDSFIIEVTGIKSPVDILDDVLRYKHRDGVVVLHSIRDDGVITVYWETRSDEVYPVEEMKYFLLPQKEIYQ